MKKESLRALSNIKTNRPTDIVIPRSPVGAKQRMYLVIQLSSEQKLGKGRVLGGGKLLELTGVSLVILTRDLSVQMKSLLSANQRARSLLSANQRPGAYCQPIRG